MYLNNIHSQHLPPTSPRTFYMPHFLFHVLSLKQKQTKQMDNIQNINKNKNMHWVQLVLPIGLLTDIAGLILCRSTDHSSEDSASQRSSGSWPLSSPSSATMVPEVQIRYLIQWLPAVTGACCREKVLWSRLKEALINVCKHKYLEGNLTTCPFTKTIVIGCSLPSHGLLIKLTGSGKNSLLEQASNSTGKQLIIHITFLPLLNQLAYFAW